MLHLRFVATPGRIGVPACTLQIKAMAGGLVAASVQARTPIRPAYLPCQQLNKSQIRQCGMPRARMKSTVVRIVYPPILLPQPQGRRSFMSLSSSTPQKGQNFSLSEILQNVAGHCIVYPRLFLQFGHLRPKSMNNTQPMHPAKAKSTSGSNPVRFDCEPMNPAMANASQQMNAARKTKRRFFAR